MEKKEKDEQETGISFWGEVEVRLWHVTCSFKFLVFKTSRLRGVLKFSSAS